MMNSKIDTIDKSVKLDRRKAINNINNQINKSISNSKKVENVEVITFKKLDFKPQTIIQCFDKIEKMKKQSKNLKPKSSHYNLIRSKTKFRNYEDKKLESQLNKISEINSSKPVIPIEIQYLDQMNTNFNIKTKLKQLSKSVQKKKKIVLAKNLPKIVVHFN